MWWNGWNKCSGIKKKKKDDFILWNTGANTHHVLHKVFCTAWTVASCIYTWQVWHDSCVHFYCPGGRKTERKGECNVMFSKALEARKIEENTLTLPTVARTNVLWQNRAVSYVTACEMHTSRPWQCITGLIFRTCFVPYSRNKCSKKVSRYRVLLDKIKYIYKKNCFNDSTFIHTSVIFKAAHLHNVCFIDQPSLQRLIS